MIEIKKKICNICRKDIIRQLSESYYGTEGDEGTGGGGRGGWKHE